ncbi:acyclic terpene utilization AtuA family protein [Burkholderia stagnalis]
MAVQTVRIGAGAGFAGDRIDPARDLAERGNLDYLVFECLAERTLAYGHLQRSQDPARGYNPLLEKRLAAVLEACVRNGTTIITNMGVANPRAAGRVAVDFARKLGLRIRVAVVEGDDVTARISDATLLPEIGKTVGEAGLRLVGANAYLGAEAILPALDAEPHLVITGRVADPSLFLAPLAHRYGWKLDDWATLGAGTVVGHLLECTTQVTGGYFADPPYKTVPNLAYVGFPLAEVGADGRAVVTKLDGTGGCVTPLTVKEQLLYEVHDPRAYLTPDVTADFSAVRIDEVGPDRIAVEGGFGRSRPERLKTIVGFDGGFLAEAEFSYAGPGAVERAQLAAEIVEERMRHVHHCGERIRLDLIGVNALHATALRRPASTEDVRLRAAMRTVDREMAQTLLAEVESLWVAGPAGGGGYRGSINASVTTHAVFVDRDSIELKVEVLQS